MAPSSDMGGMGSNPDAYPVKSMGDYSDAGPDGHHQDQGGMDQVRCLTFYIISYMAF